MPSFKDVDPSSTQKSKERKKKKEIKKKKKKRNNQQRRSLKFVSCRSLFRDKKFLRGGCCRFCVCEESEKSEEKTFFFPPFHSHGGGSSKRGYTGEANTPGGLFLVRPDYGEYFTKKRSCCFPCWEKEQ